MPEVVESQYFWVSCHWTHEHKRVMAQSHKHQSHSKLHTVSVISKALDSPARCSAASAETAFPASPWHAPGMCALGYSSGKTLAVCLQGKGVGPDMLKMSPDSIVVAWGRQEHVGPFGSSTGLATGCCAPDDPRAQTN